MSCLAIFLLLGGNTLTLPAITCGISLPGLFAGDKELLIPMYGRVHLKNDITATARQALANDADKSKQLRDPADGPE